MRFFRRQPELTIIIPAPAPGDAEIAAAVAQAFTELEAEGVIPAGKPEPKLTPLGEKVTSGGVVLPHGVAGRQLQPEPSTDL